MIDAADIYQNLLRPLQLSNLFSISGAACRGGEAAGEKFCEGARLNSCNEKPCFYSISEKSLFVHKEGDGKAPMAPWPLRYAEA